jgi:7-carboxy-7-deazaguanine synthase
MKQEKPLSVSEIFLSPQGEGSNVGIPMVFVRLFGCSMGCKFCDTQFSWKGEAKDMTVEEILLQIESFGCRRICITGGEPFEQDIIPLLIALRAKGYWVAIETNGSIYNAEAANLLNWITVAPKKRLDNRWKTIANEFKMVIETHEDLDRALDLRTACMVFLQPCNGDPKLGKQISTWLCKNPRAGMRLGYQLHKLYDLK